MFNKYLQYQRKINAYNLAFSTINFDAQTVAPKAGFKLRGEALEMLWGDFYDLSTSKEYINIVEELYKNRETLEPEQKRMIELSHKDLLEVIKLPKEIYTKWAKLCNDSYAIWHEAKNKSDYSMFEKIFEEVIKLKKQKTLFLTSKENMYEFLLDTYEPGMNTKDFDIFFNEFKTEITPLITNLKNKPKIKDDFLYLNYDISKQKEFTAFLMEYLGADKEHFYCGETEHPFSNQITIDDVRLCTKYTENNFIDNIFSVIHELGHSFFQAYINPKFAFTPIETCISMGLHESQSRLLENYIGRTRSFWVPLYPKLQELFPSQLKNIGLDEFINAVNIAKPSLVRTEADELTYTMHVIVRYEVEKEIFGNENLNVKDLPSFWNSKYNQYLGVLPQNDKEGILQDVHWSDGSFGYFPTYSLGSAFAAQFFNKMKKDLDVDKELSSGNFNTIKEWLKTNIYQFGALYPAKELLKKVTGEDFNSQYYIKYLKEKYN